MLAELIGTLVLVSAVLGASLPGPGEVPGGPLYPAVAVGVVIVALAHCFGEISGAQVSALTPIVASSPQTTSVQNAAEIVNKFMQHGVNKKRLCCTDNYMINGVKRKKNIKFC